MAWPDSSARTQWQQARTGGGRACALSLLLEDARAVLGHPPGHRLDLHRGFFEIGFDSLSLVALRQRVQARWVLSLPTPVAFEYPCPRDLAAPLPGMLPAQRQPVHTTGATRPKTTHTTDKPA